MRRAKWIAAAVALGLVFALGGVYEYLRWSLPETTGTSSVAGLSAAVDIVRDRDAITHVLASNRADGFFGLGYAHAQDRLWQMEFQRRIGFGRLSEVLGPAALPQDRFLRTVGFGRAARSAWAALPEPAKRDVEAYVAGINAFLAAHHGAALPPEFTVLRFEPEPWTGPDVIVWQKMMAWDLSGNYAFELLRHDLAAKVGPAGLADLMPAYPESGLSIVPSQPPDGLAPTALLSPPAQPSLPSLPSQPSQPDGSLVAAFDAALSEGPAAVRDVLTGGARTESLGSNNWVVDGTLSASGKPVLANDPHINARIPSIWYLAHISTGNTDVIGATVPGAPGIVLGRNRYIAWGATNVGADVEDLYVERIDETGRFVEFADRLEALQVVPETIRVKGGEPIRIDVRISRHGPLVSDAINAVNAASPRRRSLPPIEPLAFRWTALDPTDTTIAAILKLDDARNWSDFKNALRDFVAPSQNFVYADVDGHIGYLAPGRIPIRASGDGAMPSAGWTGASEWTGFVPFDELPQLYDPPSHRIVTANHRPAGPAYRYLLGLEWIEPYRAERITQLLQRSNLTPQDFAAIQHDTISLHAKAVLPRLLDLAMPMDGADRSAAGLLRQWNFDARADSAAAAVFEAWFQHLVPAIVEDELGPLTTESYQGRYSYVTRFVRGLLASAASARSAVTPAESVAGASAKNATAGFSRNWCDDLRTPQVEICTDIVTRALHEAVADLTRRLGSDQTRWRWDAVHAVVFPHQGLDRVGVLRPFISRSLPGEGDWSTVDVGAVAADQPYEQHAVASYRQIVDLSAGGDSRFLDALGQSGHFLSPHYDDFLADWRTVKHRRMRMDRAEIEQDAVGHFRLEPQR